MKQTLCSPAREKLASWRHDDTESLPEDKDHDSPEVKIALNSDGQDVITQIYGEVAQLGSQDHCCSNTIVEHQGNLKVERANRSFAIFGFGFLH